MSNYSATLDLELPTQQWALSSNASLMFSVLSPPSLLAWLLTKLSTLLSMPPVFEMMSCLSNLLTIHQNVFLIFYHTQCKPFWVRLVLSIWTSSPIYGVHSARQCGEEPLGISSKRNPICQPFLSMGTTMGLVCCFCVNFCTVLLWSCLPFSKIALHTIYLPSHLCQNPSCSRALKQLAIKKTEARQAVLFTLASGAVPVWSVHLVCERECNLCYCLSWTHVISQSARQITTMISVSLRVSAHITQLQLSQILSKLANTSLQRQRSLTSGSIWCSYLGLWQQIVLDCTTLR